MAITKSLQGVHLLDDDGNILSVEDGDTIGTAEGIIIAGKDGTAARFITVDEDGKLAIQALPAGTSIVGKIGLVSSDDHEISAYHAGRTSESQSTGTHALFTHDQQTQRLLEQIAGSLRRLEEMMEEISEVDVDEDPDEEDEND